MLVQEQRYSEGTNGPQEGNSGKSSICSSIYLEQILQLVPGGRAKQSALGGGDAAEHHNVNTTQKRVAVF